MINNVSALRTDSKNGEFSAFVIVQYLCKIAHLTCLSIVTAIVGFSCSFRIARGERYNPMLKLNTSMIFREKERKFKNIVSGNYFKIVSP